MTALKQAEGYNPLSADVLSDPATGYPFLHANPVYRCESFEPPFVILSRYDDVSAALRDIERFSSEFGQGPRFTPPRGMLSDPPEHTFFRSLVQKAFTPKAIEAMRASVSALAGELLNSIDLHQPWCLHDDYAFPLPVIVIARMLGVPESDVPLFKRWSDASVAAMGAEDPAPWADDMAALSAYLLEQIARTRLEGDSDNLIATLVRAEQDGETLGDEDILGVVNQLLVGGNETTTSLITNAVWRLLEEPGRWRRLSDEPALIPAAIEESLRFDPPVLGLYRNTTCAIEMHGATIEPGMKVLLHYAAANRDPAAFDDPDTFSLDRPPKRHLAFGLGVHFCLGAQLARLEAECALRALVTRAPDLDLIGPGERIPPFFLWGRKRLPVASGAS